MRGDAEKLILDLRCYALEFVHALTFQPELRGDAAELLQADRHVQGDGRLASQDPVKRLPGDAKVPRRLSYGQPQCREDCVAKQYAGMN